MPTYLLHGFRWHRQSIRIHIILNDLDDAAPEWILAPSTSVSLLNSLYTLYDFLPPSNPPHLAHADIPIPPIPGEEDESPEEGKTKTAAPRIMKSKSMVSLRSRSIRRKSKRPTALPLPVNRNGHGHNDGKGSTSGSDYRSSTTSGSAHEPILKPEKRPSFNDWSVVKLLEQYDPSDLKTLSQPYAYVADYMVEVSLGVAVAEEMAKYETKMKAEYGPISPVTPATPETGENLASSAKSPSMRDMRRKDRRLGWFEKLRDNLQKGEDIGWHVVVCGDEERASPSMESIRENLGIDDDERLSTPRSAGFRGFFMKRNDHEI